MKLAKICLAGICLATACGCGQKSAEQKCEPVKWEYKQFTFKPPLHELHMVSTLRFQTGFDEKAGKLHWSAGQHCYSLDEALNPIGQYGWEFCERFEEKILVKRIAGVFTNGQFDVFTESEK